MSGSLEDSWIFRSASTFSLLRPVVLVEVYEKNPDSRRSAVAKGGSYGLPELYFENCWSREGAGLQASDERFEVTCATV